VRRWIAQRGGLRPQMIFLRGKQLMSMYRPAISMPRLPHRRSAPVRRDRDLHQRELIAPAPAVLAREPD